MGLMSQSIRSPRHRQVVVPGFDPLEQPVVPTEVLPSLLESSTELGFICSAFSRQVDWQVEPVFRDSFQTEYQHQDGVTQAAVLFPLVERPAGLNVIFTRRASHLYNHAGQISFPGGRIEVFDHDAIAAALRETNEEIGVPPNLVKLIGIQPAYLTSTKFTMTPVIGVIRPGFTINADPTEVAEVFEVPLSVLMDTSRHRLHRAQLPAGGHRYYFSITWKSYFIWGATAALIRNFYHYLAAAQGKNAS